MGRESRYNVRSALHALLGVLAPFAGEKLEIHNAVV